MAAEDTNESRPGLAPAVAAAVIVPVMLGTCAGSAADDQNASGPGSAGAEGAGVEQQVAAAMLDSSVPPGARDVGIADPLVITAAGGTLTTVTVTGPGGTPLDGMSSPDRTRWISAPLQFGAQYTVLAEGVGADGRPAGPLSTTFRTVDPARTLAVESVRPTENQVVGVAMPVSIYFNRDVTDKAAVQRRLAVSPSVPTEGSFRWVSDNQLNWRPKEFWQPGTQITVTSRLRGIDVGDGVIGAEDAVSRFSVGRHQEAVGDVNAHTLTLFVDGQPVRTMPASFGRPQYPTQYGTHVAYEKHETKRMRSDTWGGPAKGQPGFYDQVLPLAVRISANGEFVHVNPETVRQQGRSNVSHGCVNLSPENGRFFYDWVRIGDPVNIVGSSRPLTAGEGDISDWLIPWEEYVSGSAL